jgi:prepilin-type N-terminal cleavage/methylation domain-containing protein
MNLYNITEAVSCTRCGQDWFDDLQGAVCTEGDKTMRSAWLGRQLQPHWHRRSLRAQSEAGFSLMEMMCATIAMGVLTALAVPAVNSMAQGEPVENATNQLASDLRLMRTKAMANTSAYRLRLNSTKSFVVEYATTCDVQDADWKVEASFTQDELKLPDSVRVTLPTSNWRICFNSQGMSDQGLTLTLKNSKNNNTKSIQVFVGGAIDVY